MKRFEVKLSERLCKCGHSRRLHADQYVISCRVIGCRCPKLDCSPAKQCICGHEQGMHADGEQWCRAWQSSFGDGTDKRCNCMRFILNQCEFVGCEEQAKYVTVNNTRLCSEHAVAGVDLAQTIALKPIKSAIVPRVVKRCSFGSESRFPCNMPATYFRPTTSHGEMLLCKEHATTWHDDYPLYTLEDAVITKPRCGITACPEQVTHYFLDITSLPHFHCNVHAVMSDDVYLHCIKVDCILPGYLDRNGIARCRDHGGYKP